MNDATSERVPATVSLLLLFLVPAGAAGAAGAKAAVDPSTGQLVVPSPTTAAKVVPSTRVGALSTAHEGLVAVRGVSRAGGVMVDLKGRFRSAVIATVATVGADGTTRIETRCVPAPASGDSRER